MRFFFLAALVAIIACTQAEEKETKKCKINDDCDEKTECCVTKGIFRRGHCKPRTQEEEPCSAPEDLIGLWDKKYYKHCPCSEDLVCEPEETKHIPFVGDIKINERCVKSLNTTARPAEITGGEE